MTRSACQWLRSLHQPSGDLAASALKPLAAVPLSKKDTSELIKTEVERLCTPYRLLLAQGRSEGEFAKSKADPQDDSEVIARLKNLKELAEAKLEAEALEVIGGSGSRMIVASAMAAQKSQRWQVKPEPTSISQK